MRIYADPEPDQTSKSQKVEFYMKNIPYLKQVIGQKTYPVPTKVQTPF
jgi:hypothetical protein